MNAVAYTYASIGGYLRLRADRDFVMIVIGDHQPAAAVSGEGASWDVPVHVIASRPQVLERLKTHGFTRGLAPARASLGPMHKLAPVFLDAFGGKMTRPGLHRSQLRNGVPRRVVLAVNGECHAHSAPGFSSLLTVLAFVVAAAAAAHRRHDPCPRERHRPHLATLRHTLQQRRRRADVGIIVVALGAVIDRPRTRTDNSAR